jgi:hypothetical protein
MFHPLFFAAIDPLFLFFPENIAVILAEARHPHIPSVADIQKALHGQSHEQLKAIASRAQVLASFAAATQEALKGVAATAGR